MDPVLDLQGAIIARLRADAGVTALVGQKVYDVPPASAVEPYISIGPTSYQEEYTDCVVGGEVFIQIDAWSTQPAQSEMRAIAHAIRAAMRADFTLMDTALVSLEHWRTDYLVDGTSMHASIRFTGYVEEQ
ncbi:DUF3168 domain-containing protein [Mesorhizobium sp. BR1-1-13]|uniref:DUF3168 domain-containing protein n=1 Tax=Mesorhizobium sp. BR1-1-13 TaxID=2876656 RepID=UPI001CD0478E|nr:DUF3168 domain-containing protein [Mesorhizobium sp. BR1-1-13]MBZ9943440.1 DUF3168 domain-containing protein [Mesorhizobium sp. BR1-1-13]